MGYRRGCSRGCSRRKRMASATDSRESDHIASLAACVFSSSWSKAVSALAMRSASPRAMIPASQSRVLWRDRMRVLIASVHRGAGPELGAGDHWPGSAGAVRWHTGAAERALGGKSLLSAKNDPAHDDPAEEQWNRGCERRSRL